MIEDFGQLDGHLVEAITLSKGDVSLRVMTYGASVLDLRVGGRSIVLGSDRFDDYLQDMIYFGAIVGPVSNRISGGSFKINNLCYDTDRNEPAGNTLHGGSLGTSQMIWRIVDAGTDFVKLGLDLPDGHMGFPGTRRVEARYKVGAGNVRLDITARTDAPTPMSFAPHCYFNLAGSGDIADHVLSVYADHYLELNTAQVSTGKLCEVTGTRFDFRQGRRIGAEPIDHNLCVSRGSVPLREVARLGHDACPFEMAVLSTQAGLQVYDAGHLTSQGIRGREGSLYRHRAGLALEPQAWPDAVNHDEFESVIVRPEDAYHARTDYVFVQV